MKAQLQLWRDDGAGTHRDVTLRIRQSARARRLILQAVPPRTVEVVVPAGTRPDTVRAFIAEHDEWIRRVERELVDNYPDIELRPTEVALAATGREVAVEYASATNGKAMCGERDGTLTLRCADSDYQDAPVLLRRWLLQEARRVLKPWLAAEAERTRLEPRSVQVRLQKTRWGSCSSRGSVSLNAALLLVSPDLVRYLFVHELSHLKHMSHSARFWKTVARHEPNFKDLDRQLAACWNRIPTWVWFPA